MIGASPPQEPSQVSTIPWKFWGLVIAAVLPNVAWSAVDKMPWPWDQAWYGKHSVELFFTLIYAPAEWPVAMLNSFGRQAPGIAWMGQFFVPLGVAIGSIDAALLLSIVAAQTTALLLVARAVWDLSGHRLSAAATAVVFMASAPLVIALSHYYLVETMQATAVAWFVFIMARAPSWSRPLIISQLVLATSFAMLAKVSSPLFCFGPGLVALYYAVRPGRRDATADRTAAAVTLAIGIPVGIATVTWYYRNAQAVLAHVSMASSGPVAELYGKAESLLPSLKFWLSAAGGNFFSWPTMVLSVATVCAGILSALTRRDTSPRTFLAAAVVASIQIAVTLVTFSLNSNRDDRYLLPLVPYFAVVLCWALVELNRKLVTAVVVTVFALQWAHIHAQSLGWIPKAESSPRWLNAAMSNPGNRTIVDSIVARTCADATPGPYWNALGVQLIWLNPPGLSYAAAKKLAPLHQLRCDYDAVAYFDGDEAEAWHRLMTKNIRYYVALESSAYALPSTADMKTVNQLNEPILDRIERSGLFQLEAGIPEHHGILVFKRVDRVDQVANGRALSDHGQHEQAVDELRKATEVDPTNIEAWANLALALERQGNMSQAIAAGTEARRLQPTHYYVHMGLARVFLQERLWADAIASAEEAERNAPGVAERVSALSLAAQGAVAAGEPTRGCRLLQSASALQRSRAIQEQLTRLRCAQ